MISLESRNSSADLQKAKVGSTIVLAGWAEKVKHLGKLAFITLRDRDGYAQIVATNSFKELDKLHEQMMKNTNWND